MNERKPLVGPSLRRQEEPKPSRCPNCGPGTLILIRDRSEGARPHLWYCTRCGQDFWRSEVDEGATPPWERLPLAASTQELRPPTPTGATLPVQDRTALEWAVEALPPPRRRRTGTARFQGSVLGRSPLERRRGGLTLPNKYPQKKGRRGRFWPSLAR